MHELSSHEKRSKFFDIGTYIDYPPQKYPCVKAEWAEFVRTKDISLVGLENMPDWFKNILPSFARFARCPIYDYTCNRSLYSYQYQSLFSGKMKSTKIIADLLGAEDIVPSTKYICLKCGNAIKIGVSVDVAAGKGFWNINGIRITPSFQREINIMNMLDVICYEKDHRPDNYFCKVDEADNIIGVSVFDNDSPSTFLPSLSIRFRSFSLEAPFVDNRGYINRPFFDKKSAECLMQLRKEVISQKLSGHLTSIEIFAVIVRVERLKKAMKRSLADGKLKLLTPEEFSRSTMLEELSGGYGNTSMKYFADKCHAEIAD